MFILFDDRCLLFDPRATTGIAVTGTRLLRGLQRPGSVLVNDVDIGSEVTIGFGDDSFADIHDIWAEEGEVFAVGTRKNCVLKIGDRGAVEQKWTLEGDEDSGHLNSIARWRGRMIYSAFGDYLTTRGYKSGSRERGYVRDLISGQTLIAGLSQPHSLTPIGDALVLANSESLEIREYSKEGSLLRSRTFDGYPRGLCKVAGTLYVGLSRSRNVSQLAIDTATIVALDMLTWEEQGRLSVPASEIYDIRQIDKALLLPLLATCASNGGKQAETVVELREQITLLDSRVELAEKRHQEGLKQLALLAERQRDLDAKENDLVFLRNQVEALKGSSSWRLTAPLRALKEATDTAKRRLGLRAGGQASVRRLRPPTQTTSRSPEAPSTPHGNHRAAVTPPLSGTRLSNNTGYRLAWVFRSGHVKSGTMMRGRQMYDIMSRLLPDNIHTSYLPLEVLTLSDTSCVAILTPSVVNYANLGELDRIKRRGHKICVDLLDYPDRNEIDPLVDMYVSSSYAQHAYLVDKYGGDRVHMITHHADPEIPAFLPPTDQLRLGYFGELGNARHMAELSSSVDFFQTNNSETASREWLASLQQYNAHYSVREFRYPTRNPAPGTYKPFTKGFVAAACMSNIVACSEETDVTHYLGYDYPYLASKNTLQEVTRAIDRMKGTFGSPEWLFALDVMKSVRHASSPSHIANELRFLMRRLYE